MQIKYSKYDHRIGLFQLSMKQIVNSKLSMFKRDLSAESR